MATIPDLGRMAPQPSPEQWKSTLLTAIAVGVLFWLLAATYTSPTPRGTPPDERGHITYIHEASISPYLLPDYLQSRVLPERKARNQLKHPPLYYSILGAITRVFDLEAYHDYRALRLVSAALVAMGLALWIITARLLGFSLLQSIPLVLSVNALPMFPYLAGSINNDNLAYLAASIAFLGLAGAQRWPRAAWYIGAAGMGMALLTKATAGLFLTLVFVLWCIAVLLQDPPRLLRNRHFITALIALVLIVGGYYIFAYIHYGSFFPTSVAAYAGPPTVSPMSFWAFLQEFFGLMLRHLPMILNHRPSMPLGGAATVLCFASLILPFVGLLLANRSGRRTPARDVANIMMIALVLTLATHVMVSWETYLERGQVRGTQARYYFYLLPAIAAFSFSGFARTHIQRFAYGAFALTAVALSIVVPIESISTERLQHTPAPVVRFDLHPGSPDQPRQIEFAYKAVGSVMHTLQSPGTIAVRGWAVDREESEPAARVDIYYDGKKIGSVVPGRPRPDVAFALADYDARNSGFEVVIEGIPPAVLPCDFQYVALQKSEPRIAVLPSQKKCR